MERIFRNKKLLTIISIFLVILISTVSFWQYHNAVSVDASGVVSVNISQGTNYTPGQEIATERTENAKKYYLGKDSYALDVSVGAIHYKDNYANPQEPWKDIDLNFENSRITKAPYILSINQDEKSFMVQDKKTGQTATIRLASIGNKDIKEIVSKPANLSTGKFQWDNVDTDLDLAIAAENTRVSFDWVVKSEQAPHKVEFEIEDGGIPIAYQGTDADGKAVEVKTQKTGNKVIESIEKGGKYPKIINPILDLQVSASNKDCKVYWDGSAWNWSASSTDVMAGYDTAGMSKNGSGLSWLNAAIPVESTITAACIKLTCNISNSIGTVDTKITGYNQPTPNSFASLADYQTKRGTVVGGANDNNITSAQVNWDNIGAWTLNSEYQSPNINSIIQEIVNQGSWQSGNAIILFWDDHDGRSSAISHAQRSAYSYNGSTIYAPELHIEYTSGSTSSISNTPSSYNFGQVTPNAALSTGLNYFSVTNNSASAVNITIGGTDLTGGTTWTLSDTATPGAATAGLKAGLNGGSYNIVIKKTAPLNILKSNLASNASQGWGLQLLSPTGDTDSVQKSGTVTLTATTS